MRWWWSLLIGAVLGFALAGWLFIRSGPATRIATGDVLHDSAVVLTAVRGLARLESVAFRLEKTVDLKNRQSRLFGLVEAEDAILLVAAGDVIAGVDFAKLTPADISVAADGTKVTLRLPAPEVLAVRLDNDRTYVRSRDVDLLAKRIEDLETRARQHAERAIHEAALEGGILDRAQEGVAHTLEALVLTLGFREVEFLWPEPVSSLR